jgi:hypothetical protein
VEGTDAWIVRGFISLAKARVRSMVSRVSPGRPRMKEPWIRMPRSWQCLVNFRAPSIVVPFRMLFRIYWTPDS